MELIQSLLRPSETRILMLILDGLGGLPDPATGRTELETANTPNLDRWAREGATGLIDPIGPGITPGSGPAHLALFGYDPVGENVGRGVLAALGTGLKLTSDDVAARINFATKDAGGNITDRRAGRISSEEGARVAKILADGVKLDGVDVTVSPVKEHRAVVVFRAAGLSGAVADTDPQDTGVPPLAARALDGDAATQRTADLANEFVAQASRLLADEPAANHVLLRGFAAYAPPPSFEEKFALRASAIAMYPMYRGLASLVGMDTYPAMPSIEAEFEALPDAFSKSDFVYLHVKQTDAAGEDGDFLRKVSVIEQVDALLPAVDELRLDLVMVTGDHSTPSLMKSHSWHPVPLLMRGGDTYVDDTEAFGETVCRRGALGRFLSRHLMVNALASVGRLNKFGA